MEVRDPGELVTRAIIGGLLGGLAFGVWSALIAGLHGMPMWSPLATYHTSFLGLAKHPLDTSALWQAVLTGFTWDAMLGMATGGFLGLIFNAALGPHYGSRSQLALSGAVLGFLLWVVLAWARLPFTAPATSVHLTGWAIAVGYMIVGALAGAYAGVGTR